MQDQISMRILKLCKRLDKFTIDDILMIACNIDESVLKLQLIKFVQDKRLVQRGDLYFYKKRTPQKNNSILSYYPAKTIDIIIRGFCCSIPGYKLSYILGVGEDQVNKIYNIFRNLIYTRQLEVLFTYYNNSPQQCRNRIFFNLETYFYVFKNQIFVAEQPINDKISFIRDWYKALKPTEQPRFKFGYITTSDFNDDARELLENYKNKTTKYDIFYMNGKNFSDLVKSSNITDASNIINVLNQHYFKIDL